MRDRDHLKVDETTTAVQGCAGAQIAGADADYTLWLDRSRCTDANSRSGGAVGGGGVHVVLAFRRVAGAMATYTAMTISATTRC